VINKQHKHFNPGGAPYMWMTPLWDKQKKGHYPPLKCDICGSVFPGQKDIIPLVPNKDDVPF